MRKGRKTPGSHRVGAAVYVVGGALAILVAVVVISAPGTKPDHGGHAVSPPSQGLGDVRQGVTTVARRETRPTLDPAAFTGQAAVAYAVAREIPEVLDQLRCYCACEQYGHVSLLSCYTDGHGAT